MLAVTICGGKVGDFLCDKHGRRGNSRWPQRCLRGICDEATPRVVNNSAATGRRDFRQTGVISHLLYVQDYALS